MSNFGFNSDLLISILLVAGSFLLALILELIGDFVFKAGKNKNATLLYRVAYNLKGPLVVFFIVSGFLWSLSLLDILAGDLILEGRHGNSLRIGSRNINPYVIISNGRYSLNPVETSLDGTILGIFEHGSIRDHFNLDMTDTHLFELMNGKVALDTVINNGGLVSKSFIFT